MKAVISGYYGFGNTGDEAIALAITRELKKQGIAPLLLSNTPEESAELYGCETAPRMQPVAVAQALLRSNLLLSGGGGLLQDKTSHRTLTYYLALIRMAKLMGKRVCVFNQSVGPLSEEGRKQVQKALRGTQVFVRDRGSLELLAELKIPARLGGDPALLLRPGPDLHPDPFTVVVAPRGDVTGALPGLQQMVGQLRARGRRVVALSFMPSHDDEAAHSLGADEVVSTRDPQLALDTIARSGFVVGVRLHAVILAAAAGVPFAGVAYDPKVQGFCDDAGAPVYPVDFDTAQLTDQTYCRVTPDWSAVEEMKFRAMQSFLWLTEPDTY